MKEFTIKCNIGPQWYKTDLAKEETEGTVKLDDNDVNQLVSYLKSMGTADMKKLKLKKRYRKIYIKLKKAYLDLYNKTDYHYQLMRGFDEGLCDYDELEVRKFVFEKFGEQPEDLSDWLYWYISTLSDEETEEFILEKLHLGYDWDEPLWTNIVEIPEEIVKMAGL